MWSPRAIMTENYLKNEKILETNRNIDFARHSRKIIVKNKKIKGIITKMGIKYYLLVLYCVVEHF